MQQQSPTTGQAIVQSPAQGYEDWQNSTRLPQNCRPPQDSRYPQGSTAFGQPQWDAWGRQGTRRQGWQTCFGCGGSHRFTEYECQGLKDLIQRGYVHISEQGRLVAGRRDRPGPELPWLGNKERLNGIKNWLRTYQGTDLDRPKEGQGQTQKQAPIICTNWKDYYQVRHTDSVTPSQQCQQTRPTLRDSCTTRTTVEPQAPPQKRNVQPGDYIQIRPRPVGETAAEARKENKSFDPWKRPWRLPYEQAQ